MPTFLFIAQPKEMIINLDLVRVIQVSEERVRFIFSESHAVALNGAEVCQDALKQVVDLLPVKKSPSKRRPGPTAKQE